MAYDEKRIRYGVAVNAAIAECNADKIEPTEKGFLMKVKKWKQLIDYCWDDFDGIKPKVEDELVLE